MVKDSTFFVFDVESIGLHGEGFAVGGVVLKKGKTVEEFLFHCNPEFASGTIANHQWVKENVPELSSMEHRPLDSPQAVRRQFWQRWMLWRTEAIMAADCPWPVESHFLNICVTDADNINLGPYPLIDVMSVMFALNHGDPFEKTLRLPNELPTHNPLRDARQSARLLLEELATYELAI